MPPVRCPQCHLPLAVSEAAKGTCPVCSASLTTEASPKPASAPSPVAARAAALAAKRARKPRWPLWSGLAVAILAFCAVWFHYLSPAVVALVKAHRDETPAAATAEPGNTEAARAPGAASEALPAAPASGEPTTHPATALVVQPKAEAGPGPQAVLPAVTPPASSGLGPATPEAQPRPVYEVVLGDGTKVRLPDGQYSIESVTGGKNLKVSGKVETLKVGRVDGKSTLDASGLEAQEIVVAGPVDGRSTVKLRSPGGSVEFRGAVSGQSRVEVDAHGGRVIFAGPAASGRGGAEINGECRVEVTAREVEFRSPISGTSTRVEVTLTRGGRLAFSEIAGNSRLYYRKADSDDPDLRVEAGAVKPPAKARQIR